MGAEFIIVLHQGECTSRLGTSTLGRFAGSAKPQRIYRRWLRGLPRAEQLRPLFTQDASGVFRQTWLAPTDATLLSGSRSRAAAPAGPFERHLDGGKNTAFPTVAPVESRRTRFTRVR